MLTIGDQFPSFQAKAVVGLERGREFADLTEHSFDGKWKVYFFWPKDFTFVCPTEIAAFGKLNREFADRDTQVLGASTDSEYVHLAWRNQEIAGPWSTALGMSVHVGNDANVALLAEVRFGAARGARDVLYLNGSTSGIGGAALVGGRLMTGSRGHGGEFGHMVVRGGAARCDCGRTGCLETEVNVQRLAGLAGAARAAEVERQAAVLAGAIANLISAFNPELVVVGGFLAELIGAQSALVTEIVARDTLSPLADSVPIVRAELGDSVLALGAAELAFAPLLADPVPARG